MCGVWVGLPAAQQALEQAAELVPAPRHALAAVPREELALFEVGVRPDAVHQEEQLVQLRAEIALEIALEIGRELGRGTRRGGGSWRCSLRPSWPGQRLAAGM